MRARPRLLFLSITNPSFVREDLRLLEDDFDVRSFSFGLHKGADLARRFYQQAQWLRAELPRADVVVGWFADYHLVLPLLGARRLGIPTAVLLGGFDCGALPEIGYGVFASRWRAPLARYVHRHASVLVPVSDALIASENAYTSWPETRRYGVREHVRDLKTPIRTIPFGYDAEAWPAGPAERPARVSTVGLLSELRTARRKGIDVLCRAAERLPEVAFEVVGVHPDFEPTLREAFRPPPNVALRPPLPREQLPTVYAQASVYAQLSRWEGLPNVLCEAMMSGCIPVGSPVFGIPDASGAVGYVVPTPEPDVVAEALSGALAASPEQRTAVRRRMVEAFSLARRREALRTLLLDLIAGREPGLR